MACKHRLSSEIVPIWEINFLFIGTFNPEWNKMESIPDCFYFYGRKTNDFWYIMPQVFGKESLMHKDFRNDKNCLIKFLIENKIGITDLISEIVNVNKEDEIHRNDILCFQDKKIEKYELVFNTGRIIKLINENNIQGVFFTRQIPDNSKSSIIANWEIIKEYCREKSINACELITPSRGYRRNGFTRDKKIDYWSKLISMQS